MIAYYERLVQEDLNVGVSSVTKRNPAGGTLTGTQVGIHTVAIGQAALYYTWDPGEVAAGGGITTAVDFSGAALSDFVMVSFSLDLSGLVLTGYVSAADVVTLVLSNTSGVAVDLASGTVNILVFKSITSAGPTGVV